MAVRGAVHLLFHPAQPLLPLYVTASQQHRRVASGLRLVVVWWCGGVECKV